MKNALKSILYQLSKSSLIKVNKFKDCHKGESCYIFGDGVSIKSMDLSLYADKKSFACNNIPFHKNFSSLDCSYCFVNAPFFFSPYFGYPAPKKQHLYEMSKLYHDLIIAKPEINYFVHLSNYPFLSEKNIYFMFRNIPDKSLSDEFIANQINCFSGVLRFAVMMAIYMGFQKIYLVGCDYTHLPSRSLHWFEKGQGILVPQINYQKEFFEIANEFIDITTITLDGTSDVINAITYKEYTNSEPVFKENTELLESRYMKILSTWPEYLIY